MNKKPNQMDSSDFGIVYKNRVGYRMREIFSAKRTLKRLGKEVLRAYELDDNKAQRVFKKYHVTKLPSLGQVGCDTFSATMEKDHENTIVETGDSPPSEAQLGYSVTNGVPD